MRRKSPVTPRWLTLGNTCSPSRHLTPQDQASSPESCSPAPMFSLICPSSLGRPLSFLQNNNNFQVQGKVDLDGSKYAYWFAWIFLEGNQCSGRAGCCTLRSWTVNVSVSHHCFLGIWESRLPSSAWTCFFQPFLLCTLPLNVTCNHFGLSPTPTPLFNLIFNCIIKKLEIDDF